MNQIIKEYLNDNMGIVKFDKANIIRFNLENNSNLDKTILNIRYRFNFNIYYIIERSVREKLDDKNK